MLLSCHAPGLSVTTPVFYKWRISRELQSYSAWGAQFTFEYSTGHLGEAESVFRYESCIVSWLEIYCMSIEHPVHGSAEFCCHDFRTRSTGLKMGLNSLVSCHGSHFVNSSNYKDSLYWTGCWGNGLSISLCVDPMGKFNKKIPFLSLFCYDSFISWHNIIYWPCNG